MNFDSFLNLNSKKKKVIQNFFFPFLLSLYEPVMCSLLTVTSYIRVLRFFFCERGVSFEQDLNYISN